MAKPQTKHNLPQEKTLKVVPSEVHATLYRIVYHEGGVVPKALSGAYNSKQLALRDITSYKGSTRTYLDHVRDKENAQIEDKDRK